LLYPAILLYDKNMTMFYNFKLCELHKVNIAHKAQQVLRILFQVAQNIYSLLYQEKFDI